MRRYLKQFPAFDKACYDDDDDDDEKEQNVFSW